MLDLGSGTGKICFIASQVVGLEGRVIGIDMTPEMLEVEKALLDALELVDLSNNIGDSRSLACHPASTTHAGLSEEVRAEMGVTEGLVRINVGLEDIEDIKEDMDRALSAAGF